MYVAALLQHLLGYADDADPSILVNFQRWEAEIVFPLPIGSLLPLLISMGTPDYFIYPCL